MTATGPASPHYVEDAVDIIRKVHRTQGPGHVLAFFTGQDEIERAGRLLSEAVAQEKVDRRAMGIEESEGADTGVSELVVVPLFGALSAEAQAAAFRPARAGVRKVRLFGRCCSCTYVRECRGARKEVVLCLVVRSERVVVERS